MKRLRRVLTGLAGTAGLVTITIPIQDGYGQYTLALAAWTGLV
jgi:hypothetical protein